MSRYLLSIYQPYGDTLDQFPDEELLAPIMREVEAIKADMQSQGVWVLDGGLHAPVTATVVRASDDGVLVTDGPFAETKEHLGGVTVLDVADLDAALAWAERLARAVAPLAIEVRPFVEA